MNFQAKKEVDLNDLLKMNKYILEIFFDVADYCRRRDLPFIVTSLISDRNNINSVSETHESGRAFDMSTESAKLTESEIKCLLDYVNLKYAKQVGAFSLSDGRPRAAIYHSALGGAPHLHFQVRP